MGARPWPRHEHGPPEHFFAQVDLADLAAAVPDVAMPTAGSLAFFLNRVIYVPPGQSLNETLPPPDLGPLSDVGSVEGWDYDPEGRPLFPKWPVKLTNSGLVPPEFVDGNADDPDADGNTWYDHVETYHMDCLEFAKEHFGKQTVLTVHSAYAGPPVQDWWQNAFCLLEKLIKGGSEGTSALPHWRARAAAAAAEGKDEELAQALANVREFEKQLAATHLQYPDFKDYMVEVARWVHGRDPWSLMQPDDLAQLETYWKRQTEFPNLTGYTGIGGLDWLHGDMVKALPQKGTPGYAALPPDIQQFVDAHRAPHPIWWHSAIAFVDWLVQCRKEIAVSDKRDHDGLEILQGRLSRLRPDGPDSIVNDGKAAEVDDIKRSMAFSRDRLASRAANAPAFEAFVGETVDWARGHDPWQLMPQPDIDQLKTSLKRARREFEQFTSIYGGPFKIGDLETTTLQAMAVSNDPRAREAMPQHIRDLLNHGTLLADDGFHQIFGLCHDMQGGTYDMIAEGYILLLALRADKQMRWGFGDCGIYSWWIKPEDLARGEFEQARTLFEMG